jgi:hypothetical protein
MDQFTSSGWNVREVERLARETEALWETCRGSTLSNTESAWTDLELIPGYRGENSATNCQFLGKFSDTDSSPTDHRRPAV